MSKKFVTYIRFIRIIDEVLSDGMFFDEKKYFLSEAFQYTPLKIATLVDELQISTSIKGTKASETYRMLMDAGATLINASDQSFIDLINELYEGIMGWGWGARPP